MAAASDLLALLPRGAAWPRSLTSALGRRLQACGVELDRIEQAASDLLEEAVVVGADQLLPDWERLTNSLDGIFADFESFGSWLGLEPTEARRRLIGLRLVGGPLSREFLARVEGALPFALLSASSPSAGQVDIQFAGRNVGEANDLAELLQSRAPLGTTVSVTVDPADASISLPAPGSTIVDPFVVQGVAKHASNVRVITIRQVSGGSDEIQIADATPSADAYAVQFDASSLGGDLLRFDGQGATIRVEATDLWGGLIQPVPQISVTQQMSAGIDVESGLTPSHDAASAPFSVGVRNSDFLVAIDLTIPASPSASPGVLFEVGEGRGMAVCIGDGSTGLVAHAAGQLVVSQNLSTNVGVSLVVDLTPFAGMAGTLLVHLDPGSTCRVAWQSGGTVTFLGSAPSGLSNFTDGGLGNWGQLAGNAAQAAASLAAAPYVTGGRAYEAQPLPVSFPTS